MEQVLKNQFPEQTLAQALEAYNHIELTQEEIDEAIFLAKRTKDNKIKEQEYQKSVAERRALFTGTWYADITESFMRYRATEMFKGKFVLDASNSAVFQLLCHYFSDPARNEFVALAEAMGVKNPDLNKGLLLHGGYGVGKTWLMQLFSRNRRQVFNVVSSKIVADEYQSEGVDGQDKYVYLQKNPFEDPGYMFHKNSGLCIDDIGAEDVKKHFGNTRNAIGDIIELRYSKGTVGRFFHVTTNLNATQLESYYGPRVTSRMREIFNIINVGGGDRRK